MIPYRDTVEDLAKHARRVMRALQSERVCYDAKGDQPIVEQIDREIVHVRNALDALARAACGT